MYVFNQINIAMTTSTKIPFDGRNIILIDKDKNFSRHSVETVLSNRLNYWKDWHCAIGLDSLYIDYDGNIYRGVCREGGIIGNVYTLDQDITFDKWIQCNTSVCTCGADMAIPKVKSLTLVEELFEQGRVKSFELNKEVDKAVAETVISTNNPNVKTITWAVGRRCNFDCWYCPEHDHNNYESHKSYDQLMSVYSKLEKHWIRKSQVKFSLLGGELTVYKDYLPFVTTLKELGHSSITTTNGSRNPLYYKDLAGVSDVCFSIHLNYVKTLGVDQFLDSVRFALEGKKDNWVNVRIMADPGNLEIAQTVYSEFKNNFGDNCSINVKPVHPAPNVPLFKYEPKEILWIRNPR